MSAATEYESRIFKIDPAKINAEAIYDAACILRSGGLVLYPTETFYALGAIPEIVEAVERVFEIKGRDLGKPLPLIASDLQAVLGAASGWPESAEALARTFWPGPLSMVIPAVASLPAVLHAKTGKIAIRISSHPVATLLARASGGLIVSTSANRAGESPPRSPGGISAELILSVEALLDAGNLPGGLPSAIVDVSVQPAALIRAGKIAWKDIRRVIDRKSENGNRETKKDKYPRCV
ncbi:Translation factor SUA5 [Syntrophobacter sp. SbD2]|nr:Translation factor SUA5 [Syntrophobacter sp. SbD2]